MEREQILADFQACTGNEHIDECIAILDQHGWDLTQALQAALSDTPGAPTEDISPPLEMPPPAPPSYSEAAVQPPPAFGFPAGDYEMIQDIPPPVNDPGGSSFQPLLGSSSFHGQGGSSVSFIQGASSSSSASAFRVPSRLLKFHVEYRDRNVDLTVPDSETVGKLKELLQAEVGVKSTDQELCGWINKYNQPVQDSVVLRELRLPLDNSLILLNPNYTPDHSASSVTMDDAVMMERLSQSFMLNITFKDSGIQYKLNVLGNRTIQEVKYDVYALIDVAVRHQVWMGWPEAAQDDSMTIAGSGVSYPCHELQVASSAAAAAAASTSNDSRPNNTQTHVIEVDEESDEDFEDAHEGIVPLDDHIAYDSDDHATTQRAQPLSNMEGDMTICSVCVVCENAANETEALQSFTAEFTKRYGDCHPVFYVGELDDAIKDALHCPARERKMLAVYLHHDNSILANVFCAQILCSESVVAYLSNNFLTWAWDLTSPANKARLLTMCTKHFGSVAANTVRNFQPDELPLLLLISRTRGSNEVVQVIHGNMSLDELMTQLIQSVEVFTEQQRGEIQEEEERNARETMLAEQDAAYQQSLEMDRAKAEAKQRVEEEKQKQEAHEQHLRLTAEQEKLKEDAEKEALRQSLHEQLPEEPPANCTKPMATLRFRCPQGQVRTRRFLADNTLKVVLNYVASIGFDLGEYKLLTTFPRRELTQEMPSKTLHELKLCPQETLMLEEK